MMYEEWLAHFNPNHDPRNGQFAKNNGSASTGSEKKTISNINPKYIAIGSAAVASALAVGGGILVAKHVKKKIEWKKEWAAICNMTFEDAMNEYIGKGSDVSARDVIGDLANDSLAREILDRLSK